MTRPAESGAREQGAVAVARVTEERLDPATLVAAVATPADGAVILFEGRVRERNQGRRVARLRYEAYAEMAEDVLREIGAEAAARFRVGRVAAAHRVGTLELGEASVAIAVAAPHRAEAYAASRWMIEEIKRRLPVWKKEEYADGEARWLDGERPAVAGARAPDPGGEAGAG